MFGDQMYDLYGEIQRINDRIGRMFGFTPGAEGMRSAEMPTVDIQDQGNDLVITVDLPGVEKNDIRLNFREDNILDIAAEKKIDKTQQEAGYIRRERGFTGYFRSLVLPVPVDRDHAKATFCNGVLSITLPKAQQEKQSEIPITGTPNT